MNKTAFVFPGQGAQKTGMGLDLYQQFDVARKVFDEADDIMGFSLSRLCFEGPDEELVQTRNVQPALLTTSIACLVAAREQSHLPEPLFTAGHSLGEYTALVASGVLSFRQALELVVIRAKLMETAAHNSSGGMLALIGASEQTAEAICAESGTEISNINSPHQIVISGDKQLLENAARIAVEKGIRKVIPLKVSGAFHSRLMASAAQSLKIALDGLRYNNPLPPVIGNASGTALATAGEIRQELEIQLLKPVLWQKSVEYMVNQGVDTFIEFGPGQVLTGLIKRIAADVRLINVGDSVTVNIKEYGL